MSDPTKLQPNIDPYIVGDSYSSVSSILEDDVEDCYNNSILIANYIKEPEDLIDKDLVNLLLFIKKLHHSSDYELA